MAWYRYGIGGERGDTIDLGWEYPTPNTMTREMTRISPKWLALAANDFQHSRGSQM